MTVFCLTLMRQPGYRNNENAACVLRTLGNFTLDRQSRSRADDGKSNESLPDVRHAERSCFEAKNNCQSRQK